MSIADKMQTMTDPVWMYKNGVGEIFERDEIDSLGPEWVDSPAKKKGIDLDAIEDKNILENIGREHGIEIDKRKSIETLRDEVKAAIDGNA